MEMELSGIGDLAAVTSERMGELLHRKAVETCGNELGKTLRKKDLQA